MIDGKICTRSINTISYLCYCNSQQTGIVENETGLRMWAVMDNEINREIYNKYKNAVNGDGNKLFVDLVKFNNIARYLKNMSKNYKRENIIHRTEEENKKFVENRNKFLEEYYEENYFDGVRVVD